MTRKDTAFLGLPRAYVKTYEKSGQSAVAQFVCAALDLDNVGMLACVRNCDGYERVPAELDKRNDEGADAAEVKRRRAARGKFHAEQRCKTRKANVTKGKTRGGRVFSFTSGPAVAPARAATYVPLADAVGTTVEYAAVEANTAKVPGCDFVAIANVPAAPDARFYAEATSRRGQPVIINFRRHRAVPGLLVTRQPCPAAEYTLVRVNPTRADGSDAGDRRHVAMRERARTAVGRFVVGLGAIHVKLAAANEATVEGAGVADTVALIGGAPQSPKPKGGSGGGRDAKRARHDDAGVRRGYLVVFRRTGDGNSVDTQKHRVRVSVYLDGICLNPNGGDIAPVEAGHGVTHVPRLDYHFEYTLPADCRVGGGGGGGGVSSCGSLCWRPCLTVTLRAAAAAAAAPVQRHRRRRHNRRRLASCRSASPWTALTWSAKTRVSLVTLW